MSSMKSLLESIDRIGKEPSATLKIEASKEESLLKEWEDFKNSYTVEEQQLDEIAPALAAVGGVLARGAAAAGGAVAKGVANVAKAAAPAVKNIAQTAGKAIAGQAIQSAVGRKPTPQQQQSADQQTQDQAAGEKLAKDTAANIQKIKSSTGANINVPGVTQSVLKAAAGQQMNPGDTKNLSTLMDPLTKTLADPAKAKKLGDIFKLP